MEVSHCQVYIFKRPLTKSRRHVFNDLQPYNCTFGVCKLADLDFSTRKAWCAHEASHGSSSYDWICKFCPEPKAPLPSNDYTRHVGRHLREIALAVIPPSAIDDASASTEEYQDSETEDGLAYVSHSKLVAQALEVC